MICSITVVQLQECTKRWVLKQVLMRSTCRLFRKVVGVSQEVLPIRISRPSLALSLCATLISLLVTPPTTNATMRLPCTAQVSL